MGKQQTSTATDVSQNFRRSPFVCCPAGSKTPDPLRHGVSLVHCVFLPVLQAKTSSRQRLADAASSPQPSCCLAAETKVRMRQRCRAESTGIFEATCCPGLHEQDSHLGRDHQRPSAVPRRNSLAPVSRKNLPASEVLCTSVASSSCCRCMASHLSSRCRVSITASRRDEASPCQALACC